MTKEEIINEIKTILKDNEIGLEEYGIVLDRMNIVDITLEPIFANEFNLDCNINRGINSSDLDNYYTNNIYVKYEELDLICLTRLLEVIKEELDRLDKEDE